MGVTKRPMLVCRHVGMIRGIDAGEPTPTGSAANARTRSAREDDEDGFEDFLAAVASAPAVRPPSEIAPSDVFAKRYRVDRLLGRGGMGAVYLARDLELDRNVALKVALGGTEERDVARLQREALAMARLSHPGIVTVYEAGSNAGQVYIAMEFVPGSTLRDWLDVGSHPWRAVVERFIPMARALASAHESGIVHRDFKPENVLLDMQGTPRIADFGVAQLARAVSPEARLAAAIEGSATRTGAIVGTPAYMAPEQFRLEGESAASDQFAFFTTLFEALHGTRPYEGRTPIDVLEAIESGRMASETATVPAALRSLIRTGLADDPAHRFESMTAVADALERVLTARRRRVLGVVAVVATTTAGGVGFASALAVDPDPCEDAGAELRERWEDTERGSLSEALGPTEEASEVLAALDAYVEALGAQRREACDANRHEGSLSDEDFALRSTCIDRAESRVFGLVDQLLASPDRAWTRSVVENTLPPSDECNDQARLRRAGNRFASESARSSAVADRAYESAWGRLSGAIALADVGDPRAAVILQELASVAEEHDLPDVAAKVGLLRAELAVDLAQRRAWLEAAARDATRSGEVSLAADAAVHLAQVSLESGELDRAELQLAHADELAALAKAMGLYERDRTARVLIGARLDLARGNATRALEALSPLIEALADDEVRYVEARAIQAKAFMDLGRLTDAASGYEAALAQGPAVQPRRRYNYLLSLGVVERMRGRYEAAQLRFEEAAASLARSEEASPFDQAALLYNQGELDRLAGNLERARTRQREAAKLLEGMETPPPNLAYVYDELGELDRLAGDLKSAQGWLAKAGGILDGAYGPGNLQVNTTLTRLARVLHDQGRPEPAMGAASTALKIQHDHEVAPEGYAATELELGRAQAAAGIKDEARATLTAAREHCEGSEHASCTRVRAEAQTLLDALDAPAPAPSPAPPE